MRGIAVDISDQETHILIAQGNPASRLLILARKLKLEMDFVDS